MYLRNCSLICSSLAGLNATYSCQEGYLIFLSLFPTVEVLIAFYENRLKDHYVITPPVLRGLRALVSGCPWSIFSDKNIQNVLHKITWLLGLRVGVCLAGLRIIIRSSSCDRRAHCVCLFFLSRRNVQRCLLAQLCPCWGLCSRMFMFRWDSTPCYNKDFEVMARKILSEHISGEDDPWAFTLRDEYNIRFEFNLTGMSLHSIALCCLFVSNKDNWSTRAKSLIFMCCPWPDVKIHNSSVSVTDLHLSLKSWYMRKHPCNIWPHFSEYVMIFVLALYNLS